MICPHLPTAGAQRADPKALPLGRCMLRRSTAWAAVPRGKEEPHTPHPTPPAAPERGARPPPAMPAATRGPAPGRRAWTRPRGAPGRFNSARPAARARPPPRPPARHLRGRRSPPSAAPGTPRPPSHPWGARQRSGCTGVRWGPPCRSRGFRASPPAPGCRKEARAGAGPRSRLEETSWWAGQGAGPGPVARATPGGTWRSLLVRGKEGGN